MVRAAAEAEKLNVPGVAVVIPMFTNQAHSVAKGLGLPDLKIAEYPGAIENHSQAEIKENVNKIFDFIVEALTKQSVNSAEASGQAKGISPQDTVFKGTFEEVNDFFYGNKWTDGLTIVPPTKEAVERMLSGTDDNPDKEIAVLPMANLRATPRNIAVNAVMAGCRPEYMPVLIAAVEAFADPLYQLKDVGTTASIKPFILVNGPIVKQLDINYGTAVMSPGRRANAAIGRALGLIIRNIAGFREGETSMGSFGWPGTPFVIAEDEDRTPWPPYHVDRGFEGNASTVTAMAMMNATYQIMTCGDKADFHLEGIARYIEKAVGATQFLYEEHASFVVFMSPANARIVARDGYSKEDVKAYIARNARLPVGEINEEFRFCKTAPITVHSLVAEGKLPGSSDLAPPERMPIVLNPKMVHIVVCGSHERNRNLVMRTFYCTPVTREIRLPHRKQER